MKIEYYAYYIDDTVLHYTRTIKSVDDTNFVLENRKSKNTDKLFPTKKLEINNKKEQMLFHSLFIYPLLTSHSR